jgi:hypothetical protein
MNLECPGFRPVMLETMKVYTVLQEWLSYVTTLLSEMRMVLFSRHLLLCAKCCMRCCIIECWTASSRVLWGWGCQKFLESSTGKESGGDVTTRVASCSNWLGKIFNCRCLSRPGLLWYGKPLILSYIACIIKASPRL